MNNNFEKMEKQRLQRMHHSFIAALSCLLIVFYSFSNIKPVSELPLPLPVLDEPIDALPPIKENRIKRMKPTAPTIPVPDEEDGLLNEIPVKLEFKEEETFRNMSLFNPPKPVIEIVEVWQLGEKPEIIKRVIPEYPEMARRIGTQGTVVLTIILGENGLVEDVKVKKSIIGLDSAAVRAVKQFVFSPAKQNDKPVRVRMNIPFQFKF